MCFCRGSFVPFCSGSKERAEKGEKLSGSVVTFSVRACWIEERVKVGTQKS